MATKVEKIEYSAEKSTDELGGRYESGILLYRGRSLRAAIRAARAFASGAQKAIVLRHHPRLGDASLLMASWKYAQEYGERAWYPQ